MAGSNNGAGNEDTRLATGTAGYGARLADHDHTCRLLVATTPARGAAVANLKIGSLLILDQVDSLSRHRAEYGPAFRAGAADSGSAGTYKSRWPFRERDQSEKSKPTRSGYELHQYWRRMYERHKSHDLARALHAKLEQWTSPAGMVCHYRHN